MDQTTTRRWRCAPGLLLAALLLLGACSSDGDGGQPSTTGESNEIDRSGIIHIGRELLLPTDTFDPAASAVATPPNDPLWFLVYGRLMRPTADGGLEPELAQSVTLVDNQTIQVDLRRELTFQDGSPFDAEAVKTGLQRMLDSGNTAAFDKNFFTLAAIDVTSSTSLTLRFPTGTAASWLDSFMASWETSIVKPGTDFSAPIGAGPMKAVSIVPAEKIVLQRWDDYWNADAIDVAGIEVIQVTSGQAATSGIPALKSGQLDFAISDVTIQETLGGSIAPITIPDPNGLVAMQLCKRDAPLSDVRVRTALAKAIDREELSEAVFAGTAVPALMLWPAGHRFYTDAVADAVADALAYDPEQARQLLEDAGYPNGVSIDVYPYPTLLTAAEVIKEQAAEVGITINIVTTTNYVAEFLQPQKAGAGMTPGGSVGAQKLASWYGDGLGNVCRYNDPEIASLASQLSQVSATSDDAVQLWAQANEQFAEQALSVPVVFSSKLAAYDSDRIYVGELWPKGGGAQAFPNVYASYVKAR